MSDRLPEDPQLRAPEAAPVAVDARPSRTRRKRVRWNDIRAQWPLAVVIAGLVVALVLVFADRWRRGAFAAGVVALGAALLRWVLPASTARLLVVRSRGFDVAFYLMVGAAVIWLALSIDALGTG